SRNRQNGWSPVPRIRWRRLIVQSSARRAADFIGDVRDAFKQRRGDLVEQRVPRRLVFGSAAIDRIALARRADKARRHGVQALMPLAGGNGETHAQGVIEPGL